MKDIIDLLEARIDSLYNTQTDMDENEEDTLTIDYNGYSVNIPISKLHLFFKAGNDLLLYEHTPCSVRSSLTEQGINIEEVRKFVSLCLTINLVRLESRYKLK